MLSVALTGSVASGKSRVTAFWRDEGVPVVSADELAREAVAPGSPGLEAVREAFGDDVITPEGALDRARMRELVFTDPPARRRLEEILHPRIQALRAAWLQARRREGARLVVSEIPLLYEVGLEDDFDVVVLVDAPEAVRLSRLVEDRGLDPREARRIMDAQMASAEKRSRADHVVDNHGTLDALRIRASEVLARLRSQEAAHQGGEA